MRCGYPRYQVILVSNHYIQPPSVERLAREWAEKISAEYGVLIDVRIEHRNGDVSVQKIDRRIRWDEQVKMKRSYRA